jgi:hypothetical protein
VGALLWAQRFVDAGNGAFAGLLSGLKAWYGEHRAGVEESQPQQVSLLMEKDRQLAFESRLTVWHVARWLLGSAWRL